MENENVLSSAQAFELNAAVSRQLPRDISGNDAQYWIEHQEKLGQNLRNGLIWQQPEKVISQIILPGKPLADLGKLEFWQEMWKYLGWELNTEGLFVPAYQDGFNWLNVTPQGLTSNKAYGLCEKHFPCWRYTDNLDRSEDHNDRDSKNGAYVIRLRDRIEADEEHMNTSARKLLKKLVPCITLTERLILELAVFLASKQHLDTVNWTLCAGSRNSVGDVPYVRWFSADRRLHVGWCSPALAFGHLRARQAVSN
jgi:hypothetical protein